MLALPAHIMSVLPSGCRACPVMHPRLKEAFGLPGDPRRMYGVTAEEAQTLLASGRTEELMDRVRGCAPVPGGRHPMCSHAVELLRPALQTCASAQQCPP